MFAQERETVLDGVAGDVIGARAVPSHGRPLLKLSLLLNVSETQAQVNTP
jgi:hypothetical protein